MHIQGGITRSACTRQPRGQSNIAENDNWSRSFDASYHTYTTSPAFFPVECYHKSVATSLSSTSRIFPKLKAKFSPKKSLTYWRIWQGRYAGGHELWQPPQTIFTSWCNSSINRPIKALTMSQVKKRVGTLQVLCKLSIYLPTFSWCICKQGFYSIHF